MYSQHSPSKLDPIPATAQTLNEYDKREEWTRTYIWTMDKCGKDML